MRRQLQAIVWEVHYKYQQYRLVPGLVLDFHIGAELLDRHLHVLHELIGPEDGPGLTPRATIVGWPGTSISSHALRQTDCKVGASMLRFIAHV